MSNDSGTVSSIIIALMSGAIPGFSPIDYIYKLMFNKPLPEYLLYGFSAIGLFSLFYMLFAILIITPIMCTFNINKSISYNTDLLNKRSKEDLIYIPLLYIVFVYVLYIHNMLTYNTMIVGIFAVMLPLLCRIVVYESSKLIRNKNTCYHPLYLFIVSFILTIPVITVYLFLTHYIVIKSLFNL